MADLKAVEAAFMRAHEAGDKEAAQVLAAEVRRLRAGGASAGTGPTAQPGQTKQPSTSYDPSAGGSTLNFAGLDTGIPTPQWLDRGLAGAGKAVVDTGRGIAGLFGADNADEVRESRALDAPLMNTGAGLAGNVAGHVGMALLPGGALKGAAVGARAAGAGNAAARLSAAGSTLIAPKSIAGAAGLGGALGLVQPAADPLERLTNVGLGGLTAGGMSAAFKGLGRVVRPQTSPDALALLQEGITPTPGQILGGGFRRVEEGLTSVPLLGDAIRSGQTRALADMNRTAFNRALAPIGESLPKGMIGREAVEHVGERLGARYDALMPRLTTQADGQFINEVQQLRNSMGNGAIDPAMAQRFENILNNQLLVKFQGPNATLTGQTLKQVEGDLGNLSKQFRSSQDPDQRLLGDAIRETQEILRRTVERSNPQVATELRSINEGYANFKRLQRAAAGLGAEDGVFTAAQLQNAVKALDRSKDKAAFARGDALMQNLTDPAKNVLSSKVPDSGTPLRAMTAMGLFGAGGGAMASGLLSPGTVGAIAAGPAMYSRPGQAAMATLLARRPAAATPAADALELLSRYGVAPALGYTASRQ